MTLHWLTLAFSLLEVAPLLSALGIGTLLGSIVGYEYRNYRQRQQQQKNAIETWYDESQDMVSRGIYTVARARFRSDIEYEMVVKDLDELSERLLVNSREELDGIPEESLDAAGSLAKLYAKATSAAEVNSQKDGIELMSELFEMAQREFSSDLDFSKTLQEASSASEGFDYLMKAANEQGVGADEFAEGMEHILMEWDSDDFAFVMTMLSENEGDIDKAIQQSMRLFLELAENLSEQTYEKLENQKKQAL